MKKTLATAAWLAVTVFAVAIGSTAVAVVGDRLGDSPTAPLAQPQLDALPTETSTTITAAGTAPTTTTIPAPTSTFPPATSTTAPSPASSAPTTTAATTTAPATTTTTTEPVSSDVRVYQLVGGQVAIEVSAHGVRWRTSTPSPGFKVEVEDKGPERVEVEFEATDDRHSSRFTATWNDGAVTVDIDEED